ncbi:hypothetical protein ABZP36_033603 [Zizania latifolia]
MQGRRLLPTCDSDCSTDLPPLVGVFVSSIRSSEWSISILHRPLVAITVDDLAAAGAGAEGAAALHSVVQRARRARRGRADRGVGGALQVRAPPERALRRAPDALQPLLRLLRWFPSTTPPAWIPDPEAAVLTNVGRVLEVPGREFLGEAYKDPISSFSDFHKFSNENPEATFVLHDGPPYANGDLHMGHALDKILKDIINRYKVSSLLQFNLIVVLKSMDKEALNALTPIKLRQKAAKFAKATFTTQMKYFKSVKLQTLLFFWPIYHGLAYHGKSADTWAVGVTLYCMVLGQYPFLGDTFQETYDKSQEIRPPCRVRLSIHG